MKIYGLCEVCKKKGWFIRKRKVELPIGLSATSKKMMCARCGMAVNHALNGSRNRVQPQ